MNDWLFHQAWWLDAVAPGRWQRIEVKRNGRVLASMPLVIKRRYGLTALSMPPLTQFLGPWVAPPAPGSKYPSYLGQQKKWLFELIDQLPNHQYFSQTFQPEITNWLPFYWKGFEATVRYTYILKDMENVHAVMANLQENIRRDIKKAETQLTVREADDITELMDINRRSFARLGRKYPHSDVLVSRVFKACRTHEAGRILIAEDRERRVHAALFYVWDSHCTRYLIGGGDPELRKSGATSLLMWFAMQDAALRGTSFDFEGSMLEPVERFVRAFGGRQTPYFYVSHKAPMLRFADCFGLLPGARRVAAT